MIHLRMRKEVAPHLLDKIILHPFNIELTEGTLSAAIYQDFLEQDNLYLNVYSEALQMIGNRLEDEHSKQFFLQQSRFIREFEQILHTTYGLTPIDVCQKSQHPPSQTFFPSNATTPLKIASISNYTHYLLTTAKNVPIEVAIASLLPCYDIYTLLGQRCKKSYSQNNPYRKWIDTYSDPDFIQSTEKMIEITNRLAQFQNELVQEEMIEAYRRSTIHELSFIDEIYNRQQSIASKRDNVEQKGPQFYS